MWRRDRDVVGVGVAQDVVDELRVGAVVLVDLEADRARLEQRVEAAVVRRPGARLEADVDRPALEAARASAPSPHGGSSKPARDERRHAAGQRGRQELRADRVDVAVDGARAWR